ncbi:hypothetical protein ACUYGA_23625 [Metapseudomonas otitidis]|uniref:hypothetical protein n=1 Tax=Metapseudomonas otitidis TaxID=319939 RepID=UPI00405584E9
MNTDGIPLGKYTTQLVGGSVYGGVTLCAGAVGLGCTLGGGSLALFGAGNVTEGSTGFYTHFPGDGSAFNPVETDFNNIPGGYGAVLYGGVDLAVSVGVGFVKISLAMGKVDGFNRLNSIFRVMVSRMDNNCFLPLTYKSTPYGTAGAIYLLGVGGKGYDFWG